MFIKDYLENKVKAEDFFTENEKLKNESNIAEKMGLSEEDYQKALKGKKINEILKKYAIKRIEELVKILNEAAKVYYSGQDEIMSNYEYDSLYDELLSLETRFSYELENSPTKSVGYEVESKLKKEKHEYAALSLDKTKNLEELKSWLKDKEGTLGWKLDGLTVQLTYDNKKLTKAVTRGNEFVKAIDKTNVRHDDFDYRREITDIVYRHHLTIPKILNLIKERHLRIPKNVSDMICEACVCGKCDAKRHLPYTCEECKRL